MKLAIDKQAHFWWGMAMCGVLFPLFGVLAAVFSTLAGVAKEIYDKESGTGTPDPFDALATAAGAVVGLALCSLSAALA